MKDHEIKKNVQNTINRRLSGLQDNPNLAWQVMNQQEGEQIVMKKKLSFTLVFALCALLVMGVALAVSLSFSPRYDAVKLANEALSTTYGIEDKMLTVFHRQATQNPDGSSTITYRSVEGIEQLGLYTVEIKDGKAKATWSLEGKETSGGLKAEAWGREQLQLMVEDYEAVMSFLHQQAPEQPQPATTPSMTEEDYKKAAAETKSKVLAAAKITRQEAFDLGILALQSEKGLTQEQVKKLIAYEEDDTYAYQERPLLSIYYHLSQGAQWAEKDGIYVVEINMETGEVEDLIYDSGLAANG